MTLKAIITPPLHRSDFIALDAYLRDPEHCRLTAKQLEILPVLTRRTELQTPVPFARPNLEGSALRAQCDAAAKQLNRWLTALSVIVPTPWVSSGETELESRLSIVGFEVGDRSVQATVRMFLHAPLPPSDDVVDHEEPHGLRATPVSTHSYHQSASAGIANALLIGSVCTVAHTQTSTVALRKVVTTSRSTSAFYYPKRHLCNGDRVKIQTLVFAKDGTFAYVTAMTSKKGKALRGLIQLIYLIPYVADDKPRRQLVRSSSEKHLNQDMIVSFDVLRPLAVELNWFDSEDAVDDCRPVCVQEIQYMPLRNLYRKKFERFPTDREKLLMQAFVRACARHQEAETAEDNVPPFLPLDEVKLQLGRSEHIATVIAGPAPCGAHGSTHAAYHVAFTSQDNVQIACVPARCLNWIRRFEGDSQPDYAAGNAVQVMTTAGRWEDAVVESAIETPQPTEPLQRRYYTRLANTPLSLRITHAYDLRKRRDHNRRARSDTQRREIAISLESSRNSLVKHARSDDWDAVRELIKRHADDWVSPAIENPTKEQLLSCPLSELRVLLPHSRIGTLRKYQVEGMERFRSDQRVEAEAKEDEQPSRDGVSATADDAVTIESKEETDASAPSGDDTFSDHSHAPPLPRQRAPVTAESASATVSGSEGRTSPASATHNPVGICVYICLIKRGHNATPFRSQRTRLTQHLLKCKLACPHAHASIWMPGRR